MCSFLDGCRDSISARLPDLITPNKVTKVQIGAGRFYSNTVMQIVRDQFRLLVKDRNHVYDSSLEHATLKQIEKGGFADIAMWSLQQIMEVLPKAIYDDGGDGEEQREPARARPRVGAAPRSRLVLWLLSAQPPARCDVGRLPHDAAARAVSGPGSE